MLELRLSSQSLRDCEELDPQALPRLQGAVHSMYREAVESNIHAMNAERERLRQIVNQQRRVLGSISDRLRHARRQAPEDQVDTMRVLMLQRARLNEDSARRRDASP